MHSFLNQVQLVGRAGHAPELIHLSNQPPRAVLRLYCDPARAAVSGHSPQVFALTAWGAIAEQFSRRIRRGDRVFVQGRLVNRRVRLEGRQFNKVEVQITAFNQLSEGKDDRLSSSLAAEPLPSNPSAYIHE